VSRLYREKRDDGGGSDERAMTKLTRKGRTIEEPRRIMRKQVIQREYVMMMVGYQQG
jgi:hypothetical protein